MINVCFVCHGNICRSPMAEFVFRDLCEKKGTLSKFNVTSRATSNEEEGNPVHYGTKRILARLGIDVSEKYAERISKDDIEKADYIIIMDEYNRGNLYRLADRYGEKYKNAVIEKTRTLLSFTKRGGNIADPWYTGDFEKTYEDVKEGCECFYDFLSAAETNRN